MATMLFSHLNSVVDCIDTNRVYCTHTTYRPVHVPNNAKSRQCLVWMKKKKTRREVTCPKPQSTHSTFAILPLFNDTKKTTTKIDGKYWTLEPSPSETDVVALMLLLPYFLCYWKLKINIEPRRDFSHLNGFDWSILLLCIANSRINRRHHGCVASKLAYTTEAEERSK